MKVYYNSNKPPKMLKILKEAEKHLGEWKLPHFIAICSDKHGSQVYFEGSFQEKEEWPNNDLLKSPFFKIHIVPEKNQSYYEETDYRVTIDLVHKHFSLPDFRKYTGSVEKVLNKLEKWLELAEKSVESVSS